MARFDFIESASASYRFTAQNLRMILHLAALPFVLKLGAYLLTTALGLEMNFLRQGLLLLPAFFIEGLLVSLAIRWAVLGDMIVFDRKITPEREQSRKAIAAGAIYYTLIKILLAVMLGLALSNAQGIIDSQMPGTGETGAAPSASSAAQAPDIPTVFLGLAILAATVWGFRLLWLNVPAALGLPVKDFMERCKGAGNAAAMVGGWLLSYIPANVIALIIAQLMIEITGGTLDGSPPTPVQSGLISALQAASDTLVSVIGGICIAKGYYAMIKPGRHTQRS